MAVNSDGTKFLINPRWQHFSTAKASQLVLVDANDLGTMDRDDAPDPSAWSIHSAIHRFVPQGRAVLHLHPKYATVLASLKDPEIKPIDQTTARFYKRVAIDLSFGGIANEELEGERIAKSIGHHNTVMMGNHGVTTLAPTLAEAYDNMYYLERASRTLVLAYQTGQPLNLINDNLAEQTAKDWQVYKGAEFAHFEEMKRILDKEDPSYKD